MTKNAKVVAMVQLPPPMHGAAKMNQHAIDALSAQFDLQVIEMRFARTVSEVNRFSLRKLALAVWLLMRLAPPITATVFMFCWQSFFACR